MPLPRIISSPDPSVRIGNRSLLNFDLIDHVVCNQVSPTVHQHVHAGDLVDVTDAEFVHSFQDVEVQKTHGEGPGYYR